jgi:hypothetical protein
VSLVIAVWQPGNDKLQSMNQHLVVVKLILLYYLQQVFQSSDLYSTGKRAINPLGQILEIKQTTLLQLPEQLTCADDD